MKRTRQVLLLHPPYFTSEFHIVSAKFFCAYAECWTVHEFEQRLRTMTEVVALAESQIKPLPTIGTKSRLAVRATDRGPELKAECGKMHVVNVAFTPHEAIHSIKPIRGIDACTVRRIACAFR